MHKYIRNLLQRPFNNRKKQVYNENKKYMRLPDTVSKEIEDEIKSIQYAGIVYSRIFIDEVEGKCYLDIALKTLLGSLYRGRLYIENEEITRVVQTDSVEELPELLASHVEVVRRLADQKLEELKESEETKDPKVAPEGGSI